MAKLDSTLVYGSLNVTKSVTANNTFISENIDGNPTPNTNQLRLSGYGIIGNRGAIYMTNSNSGGELRFGIGGIQGQGTKLTITSSDSIFTGGVRGTNFYDNDNTGYYVNPNSDSNLYRGKFRANDQADNNYTLAALWTQNYNSGPAGIAFHISGNVGKLLEMRTNGNLYWENSEVLTTSSGYLPLSGGTLTGDITVGSGQTSSNIYMADSNGTARRIHTNSDRIGFLTSGNGWGSYCYNNGDWKTDMISYAGASMRAPLFYDLDNTGYYLNPAGSSNLNTVAIAGVTTLSGRLNLDLTTDYDSTVVTSLTQAPLQIADVNIGTTNAYLPLAHMSARYTSGYRTHMNIGLKKTASAWGDSTTGMYVALGGNDSYPTRNWLFSYGGYIRSGVDGVYATDSFRAPLFYDSDDTSYYLDPSTVNTSLNANGSIKGDYFVGSKWNTKGYTVYKGYDNFNHFISVRGYAQPGQGKTDASIIGMHITSFVEYTTNSSSGWFFMNSSGTNYEQIAKITKDHSVFLGSARAPLFYDSNNTAYYTNPAGTSIVQRITHINHTTPILIKVNSGYKSWVHHVSTSSSYHFAPSATNGAEDWDWSNQMSISTTGVVVANNFVIASDKRSKTKIEDLTGDNVDISWKSFEMKGNEGEYRTGVIAQELEENYPEFVNTDDRGFKSVKYIDLLIAKIAELEARLEKLEK